MEWLPRVGVIASENFDVADAALINAVHVLSGLSVEIARYPIEESARGLRSPIDCRIQDKRKHLGRPDRRLVEWFSSVPF